LFGPRRPALSRRASWWRSIWLWLGFRLRRFFRGSSPVVCVGVAVCTYSVWLCVGGKGELEMKNEFEEIRKCYEDEMAQIIWEFETRMKELREEFKRNMTGLFEMKGAKDNEPVG